MQIARTENFIANGLVSHNTRWHEDDLVGYVLRDHAHEGWEVINLPAIAEYGDPLGRRIGAALWPEMYPESELATLKITLGSYDYGALYDGRPVPLEGGIFKLPWFANRYDVAPASGVNRIVQSWDTGQKEKETNDPSVCSTWAETATEFFLLHVYRERVEYPSLRRMAESLAERWQPSAVLIEDKSSGQSLVQDLRSNTRLPLIAVEPEGDKVVRAISVSPLAESGRIRLPRVADWLPDYEHELTRFPSSKHDDQIDSTTQALRWMSGSGPGIVSVGVPGPVPFDATDPIMGMQS